MRIDTFTGNSAAVVSLVEKISSAKLSHGILISAPMGYGANYFARLLAADILGADDHDFDLIQQECHPCVQTVRGSGTSGQIKVDSVRQINDNVNFSSLSGAKRVVIIENCENFNPNSGNALLKNLEEPKDDITYILTVRDISKLLPTIRSRCAVYTLERPSIAQCMAYFSPKEKEETVQQLATIYKGNIGLVKQALENPKRLEILQKALLCQKIIQKNNKYELAKNLFSFQKKKEDFLLFLKDLEYICSENINESAIKTLNAIMVLKPFFERNANLNLIIQNFIIAV